MTFDTIAFTQDELDNALNLCCTSIGLCDNDFILPQIAGINCIGFVPQFAPQICEHSPSVSSYITSYQYEYEYEYITSYSSSYTTSAQSSFATSFVTGSGCIYINGYGVNLI